MPMDTYDTKQEDYHPVTWCPGCGVTGLGEPPWTADIVYCRIHQLPMSGVDDEQVESALTVPLGQSGGAEARQFCAIVHRSERG